jgi:Holliday junction resolvase
MNQILSWWNEHPDLVIAVVAVIVLLLLAVRLGLRMAHWRAERRIARNRKVGQSGERHAQRLLRRAGFEIEDQQPSGTVQVQVDGVTQTFTVRADLIARKGGRRFVVEVKGTEATATVANRDTRRQLLEYRCVFDVDGVLLVDSTRERVHEITFPQR